MMAARAPAKRDLGVLSLGTPRARVIAELGPPLHQATDERGTRDVFSFKQGYTLPTRVGRVTFHAVADVFSVGLWEVVGTPLESALEGEGVQAEVLYDRQEYVRRVEFFSGAHLAAGGPTLAPWMRHRDTRQTMVVEADESPGPDLGYYQEVVSTPIDDETAPP